MMRFTARFAYAAFAGAALALTFSTAGHADDFPSRNITMIVPFTAGGAGDILGRMVGHQLEQKLGKAVVVENKPGAGGVIGANLTAQAAPDGHTLMIAPSATMAVNVTLFKALSYDPAKDFVPLALAAATPFVLVVNPDLPVRSVQEFIAYAKKQDGKLSYATAGPGVPHHLFAEMFKTMTGIQMSPVPYKGSLPGLNDVVAGHIPVMFVDLGPALGLIQSGKVRPIGISTASRLPMLPDVPPIAESGVPGFDAASWQMIVAPAKTPPAIVQKLHGEISAILATDEARKLVSQNGMLPMPPQSVAELQAFVNAEIQRWGDVVRKAGIAGTQ
ncbi:tripartite tricarboxylate transporter substrate binding protein [Pseudorhodoplanes sp.]|uniref:Bug family tripartite tricarboxylate transporter substrate binding protein n=1 Tax=Pseudorhodoplanes sp. TaxID=1934341 RepID=UPI002B8FEF14|nr:tripartite tricarboxylate transporter substrate binding protein [Pseudorhodoplanes sp.]HWV51814.1 tripartite tricarboxylate transporter substrate binding protein [Pseudorhodoplanes sp.]